MLPGGWALHQKFVRDQTCVQKEKSASDGGYSRKPAIKAGMEEQRCPDQRRENQRQHQIVYSRRSSRKPQRHSRHDYQCYQNRPWSGQ